MSDMIRGEVLLDYIDGILPEDDALKLRERIQADANIRRALRELTLTRNIASKISTESGSLASTFEDDVMAKVHEAVQLKAHTEKPSLAQSFYDWMGSIFDHSTAVASGMIGAAAVMLIMMNIHLYQTRISPSSTQKQPTVRIVDVYMPTQEVTVGQRLNRDLFRQVSLPEFAVQPGAITDPKEIDGKFARTLLVPEQQVTTKLVSAREVRTDGEISTPPGFRTVSISIATYHGLEELLKEGKLVDIIWASEMRGSLEVQKIAEHAEILSVSRDVIGSKNSGTPRLVVQLIVSSEEATRVLLAEATGALILGPYRETEVVFERNILQGSAQSLPN